MNNSSPHNQILPEHEIRKVRRENFLLLLCIRNSPLGKPKWVPLPIENNAEGDTVELPSANPQSNVKPASGRGNRAGRNTRSGRGGTRIRTRSLDATTPKRNRKNRANAAAYNTYQDYYSYYCMSFFFAYEMTMIVV